VQDEHEIDNQKSYSELMRLLTEWGHTGEEIDALLAPVRHGENEMEKDLVEVSTAGSPAGDETKTCSRAGDGAMRHRSQR